MLQIDHVYEFLYQELFKDFDIWYLRNSMVNTGDISISDISLFTQGRDTDLQIFFYDQEPFIKHLATPYIKMYNWVNYYSWEDIIKLYKLNQLPHGIPADPDNFEFYLNNQQCVYKKSVLVTSEYSNDVNQCIEENNFKKLYYFFHGFAALDWYRGYYALNYNKLIVKEYNYDFISFNRIINSDRSYRIYFVSLLKETGLLDRGQVSFNVTDNLFDDWRDETSDPNSKLSEQAKQHAERHLVDIDKLVIDHAELHGSASADILRNIDGWMDPNNHVPVSIDAFWHIVTETVFYYDKLHLTEKIFKPIVSKQPFMLLAAPGNLAYLKSYGFKTFDSVLDESYDLIQDPDLRTEAVVRQLHWYCNLTPGEKTDIIKQLEPIIDYNFHHFYGEFRHIITQELLDNTKTLFKEIGYDDGHINYANIHHVLTH
jgi:hypothetical protein